MHCWRARCLLHRPAWPSCSLAAPLHQEADGGEELASHQSAAAARNGSPAAPAAAARSAPAAAHQPRATSRRRFVAPVRSLWRHVSGACDREAAQDAARSCRLMNPGLSWQTCWPFWRAFRGGGRAAGGSLGSQAPAAAALGHGRRRSEPCTVQGGAGRDRSCTAAARPPLQVVRSAGRHIAPTCCPVERLLLLTPRRACCTCCALWCQARACPSSLNARRRSTSCC